MPQESPGQLFEAGHGLAGFQLDDGDTAHSEMEIAVLGLAEIAFIETDELSYDRRQRFCNENLGFTEGHGEIQSNGLQKFASPRTSRVHGHGATEIML